MSFASVWLYYFASGTGSSFTFQASGGLTFDGSASARLSNAGEHAGGAVSIRTATQSFPIPKRLPRTVTHTAEPAAIWGRGSARRSSTGSHRAISGRLFSGSCAVSRTVRIAAAPTPIAWRGRARVSALLDLKSRIRREDAQLLGFVDDEAA